MTEIPPTEEGTPLTGSGPSSPDASSDAPAQTRDQTRDRDRTDPLRSSATARAWVAVVALGVVLVLLIVFIAQNTDSVTVSFLGWRGRTPLAVALLIATAAGLFLAAVAGTLRIWQLRRRVRRETKRRR
jgi:uncharacterized integral membrane protein